MNLLDKTGLTYFWGKLKAYFATKTELNAKQDTLTFDTTPTFGSANPVTSGGLYSALNSKQDELTFDSTPTPQSENPVTSTGIFNYVNPLFDLVNPPIEYIPTSLTIRPYTILDTNKYGASDQYKHVLIPIGSGYKVTVESNSSTRAQIAWFTSDASPTGGGTPPFVSGTGKIRTTSAGSTESFIAPNGANYLYVYLGQSPEYSYAPTLVTVTGNTSIEVDPTPIENSNRLVKSGGVYSALSAKQDTISDLATIRSGASAGSTALQPGSVPSFYSGTSDPSSSVGVDGDIYIKLSS